MDEQAAGYPALRIGIDGYNLALPHGTGVATYGAALARTLRAMGHDLDGIFGLAVGREKALREVLFFDTLAQTTIETRWQRRIRFAEEMIRSPFGARAVQVPITDLVEKAAFAGRLPAFDRVMSSPHLFEVAHRHFDLFGSFLKLRVEKPPAIMHWTYPLPVELLGSKNIYTLHDLVPLRLPYTTLDFKRSYYRLIVRCIRQADHICTVSDASRSDILSRFDIHPEKVTNTYQASPVPAGVLAADPSEDAQMIEGLFDLRHRGYFLFFGALEPKKNVGRLIEAYLSSQSDTPLVIVGTRAWQAKDELKMLSKGDSAETVYGQRLAQRIVRLDYLPRTLLLRLIRGARAVTFPSLYEGFGLPVLESMQLGTPVLASNTSSVPEVAGEAAILVDPYDVQAITAALRELDANAELRADLARRGMEHSQAFSEGRYSERLRDMYAKIGAEK